ncbi:MarR family transcriptional regulator [Frankia sp. AiPs1]|uniref:MarR family winged helix-turn-helix transcriptional regulator n=1 Tax=Frankia sp. AiPs1 TaxID=573493 RepID=UPI0020448C07|nr:MarR family transcriptional regulator [Frankia sp. AiPs1]
MADELALLIADVYETAGALRRWGQRVASAEGRTQAQWQLLGVLSGPPLTVPAAARRLGLSRQAVQRTANELVDDGLAHVIANPDHRTAGLLQLTDHGHDALSRMAARAAEDHRELLVDIPLTDVTHARALLRELVTRLRAADPSAGAADPTRR